MVWCKNEAQFKRPSFLRHQAVASGPDVTRGSLRHNRGLAILLTDFWQHFELNIRAHRCSHIQAFTRIITCLYHPRNARTVMLLKMALQEAILLSAHDNFPHFTVYLNLSVTLACP